MIEKQKSRTLFYILLAMLLGLAFVRYALQIYYPRGILLLLAILIACVGDPDEIVAMCICCIPLQEMFHLFYVLLGCFILYALKYSHRIRINLIIMPVFLIILWELLHCLWNPFSPVTFVSRFLPYVLLTLLVCTVETEFDYDFITRALAISTAAMCICLLGKLLYVSGFDVKATFAGLQRLGMDSKEVESSLTVTGGEINPNTLGILCVLCISGLMQLRTAGRKQRGDLAIALILLVFGALTSSRTYLVCLAAMIILLLFSQKRSLSHKIKFLCGTAALILVALVVLNVFFSELMDYYIDRFQVLDITTGRFDLIKMYHEFIFSKPQYFLYGVGIHDFDKKMINQYKVASYVPHNGIQELLLAWGVPGLLIFGVLLLLMIRRSKKIHKKQSLLNYIPLLIILLKSMVGQLVTSPYTMLALSYAYLSLCCDMTRTEQSEEIILE